MKISNREFDLGNNLVLRVEAQSTGERLEVVLTLPGRGECLLHWGLCQAAGSPWQAPPPAIWPEGTRPFGKEAVQTPFSSRNGARKLTIGFSPGPELPLLVFVLFFPAANWWVNNHGKNYTISLRPEAEKAKPKRARVRKGIPAEDEAGRRPEPHPLAAEIIQAETGRNSWTLMHRFNLCHDLLDRVGSDTEGLALLFVWLRFSALRQLDWQRNYNTKPRELAHAQKRLTIKLAERYRQSPPAGRELLRFMLSTVGRGGEGGQGQRIRDDILHIMHRHRIKEVTGHFMEEWHQKLHNNATADDIVICEAYLAFLRSNGNLASFYHTLEQGGVTRQRLEGFERPIRTAPDFVPYLKDGLIHDFSNYLKLLKSIHSATDLASAVDHSLACLDEGLRLEVIAIRDHQADMAQPVADQVRAITRVRRALRDKLANGPEAERLREQLYLDLALEEFLRTAVEKRLHQLADLAQLAPLIGELIENVSFSHDSDELAICASHWQRLLGKLADEPQWALHARAVLDRLSRVLLASIGDYYHQLLQAKAEELGRAFSAEPWTIELFSQEIVRSGSAFVLSLLLSRIDPVLRRTGQLGAWQVISAAATVQGRVKIVALSEIQDSSFTEPVVVISDRVTGDEEVPAGIKAILTPATVDILSHLAVRARNCCCLFATCYEPKIMAELKAHQGKQLQVSVSAAGDVEFAEIKASAHRTPAGQGPGPSGSPQLKLPAPDFAGWALAARDFNRQQVGSKSYQLRALAERLPDWLHLPRSAAIPFGVCEKVLADEANKQIRKRYRELTGQVEQNPAEILPRLRAVLMDLEASPALISELKPAMAAAGLAFPGDWQTLWTRIKQVWGSKWNARAFRSRRIRGLADDSLFMAVLIQQVVEAEYAFVIHTANPFTGDPDELYAEVVAGLGETLCSGNYPGRALSFTCRKGKKLKPRLLSYPSKHVALRGSGLIVRSDSNGEDLEEYAGAGLYDSVLMTQPRQELLDYSHDPLLWEEGFQREFMEKITRIGMAVEAALGGCPQDIEGAWENDRYHVVQTRAQAGVRCR